MFSWHAIPFIRILVPFLAGVIFSFFYPSSLWIPLALTGTFLSCLLIFNKVCGPTCHFRMMTWQGILWSLCLALLGYIRTYTFNETRQAHHFSSVRHAEFLHVTVDDAVIQKTRFYRCYAKVDAVYDSSGKTHAAQGTLLLYINTHYTSEKPVIGDRFMVRAHIQAIEDPANPGEFNFRKYLSYKNIHFQLFSDSAHTLKSSTFQASTYRTATIFRDKCLDIIRKYIPSSREQGVAEALLLGYKDDLDPAITQAFSRTGTLHVLAVSGMHAGIIFLLISLLTKSLEDKKRGKWIQLVLLLTGLWFYALMTGLSSSVLRATVMFSIMSIGKVMRHRTNIFNTLYASAFVLLVYHPLYIFDVGFQLSYLAVLGIIWIQPMISKWYHSRHKAGKYLWDLLSVSLAAQVLTFPVSLFYFHQFPNYFLLSNMLIIPITSFILIGLIFMLAFFWIPFIATWTGKLLSASIRLSNWLVTEIDQLPYSFINGFNLDLFQLITLFAIILLFISFILHKSHWIFFSFLTCVLIYGTTMTIYRYQQNRQRLFISHVIRGHDVFTCIEGRSAWIISDPAFLRDESAIKFFIEPMLWEKGIKSVYKTDFSKDFQNRHLKVQKGIGFQFFDKTMTIGNSVHNSIHDHEWVLINRYQPSLFQLREKQPNKFIISNKIDAKTFSKLRRSYARDFKGKVSRDKKPVICSF